MQHATTRIQLGLAVLFCIAITLCSSLLYLSYIAGAGIAAEMAASQTNDARRAELLVGINNATSLQTTLVNTIWWLAFVAGLLTALPLFRSFKPSRN